MRVGASLGYCVECNESSTFMKGRICLEQPRNNKFSIETLHSRVCDVAKRVVKRITLVPYLFEKSKQQIVMHLIIFWNILYSAMCVPTE